jgi:hypothetical protein|tara:strand:+ start:541 stop:1014 length:474 start_codon:yes stop_codon:yes gene_type:complete
MKTGNIEYVRAVYYLKSSNIDKTLIDFELLDHKRLDEFFTKKIRIEKDNGYHDRSRFFNYWLLFRNDTNWKRCLKTGLVKTSREFVFEGNISEELFLVGKTSKGKNWENPKHFLIVQFSKDCQTLVVDLFKDFYPHKKELIEIIIDEHQYSFTNKVT